MTPIPHPRTFAVTLAVGFCVAFLVFYGASDWISGFIPWRISVALPFDGGLPFSPAWSLIYLSMPLMLLWCVWVLNWQTQWRVFMTLLVELLIACGCFLLLPIEPRPLPHPVEGFWQPWFAFANTLNGENNLFPSLHVAFACTAAIALSPVLSKRIRAGVWLWVGLIALSTLLIYEHYLLDTIAGALLAVFAWRILAIRTQRPAHLQRVRLEWLWLYAQWHFARRHRRYAGISLAIALRRLRHPRQGTLLTSGYCFLQSVDDIMDGDQQSDTPPEQLAESLHRAWLNHTFAHDDLMLMAKDFQQRLLQLPNAEHPLHNVAVLIKIMQADYQRAQQRELWTQTALNAQHQATFTLSLNLLLAALQSSTRAQHVPALIAILGWCSVMRDLREDLAAGILNIPAEIFSQLTLLPVGEIPDDHWLAQLPLQHWMREQHRQAIIHLAKIETQINTAIPDKTGMRMIRLFAHSVDDFATRRFYTLYPWLNPEK